MKRLLALAAAVLLAHCASPAFAQDLGYAKTQTDCATPGNTPVVGGVYPVGVNTSNQACVYVGGGSLTPSGTQDTNLKQVNGATVNVGTGAASTGTQRVTTSTDSGNAAIGANGSAAKTSSTLIGVSDGTNQQQVLAPIALSPTAGVNGNNTASVANWIWNGSAYVAQSGTTAGTNIVIAPSALSSVGIAPVVSASAEACHVLKAGAGNLYGVSGYIGAPGWLMVFNATSAPGDGAVTPVAWAYAGAAGSWSINYGDVPLYLGTGITVCASSTGPLTKTAYSTNTVFSGRVQ